MELIPVMINVHYAVTNNSDKFRPVTKVEELGQLKKDPLTHCWYSFNHYRSYSEYGGSIQYSQIGFKCLEKSNEDLIVYIENEEINQKQLHFDRESGMWFELSKFQNGNYSTSEKDQISGFNQSGLVQVKVKCKSTGELLEENSVFFLPSSLEVSDYKVMIAEIHEIYIELLKFKYSSVRLSEKKVISLKWVEDVINKIEPALKYIDLNPSENLSLRLSNQKATNNSRRFDVREEISKKLFEGSTSIKSVEVHKNTNIYEHRVIKQFLNSLKFLFELYLQENLLDVKREQIKNELKMFEKKSMFLNTFSETDYKKLKCEILRIQEELSEKKDILNIELNKIKSDSKLLVKLPSNIDIKLKFKVLKVSRKNSCMLVDNNLITQFESSWDNGWDIELLSYSYNNNHNEKIVIKWPHVGFSKKMQFQLVSTSIKDHLRLLEFLENEEIVGEEVLIHGAISYNQNKLGEFLDIVGVKTGLDEKYNSYNFNFFNIYSILVNGKEPNFTCKDTINDIMPFLLKSSKDYSKKIDKLLQSKLKTTSFEQKLKFLNQISFIECDKVLYEKLIKKIKNLLALNIFKRVESPVFEKVQPTQLFLHDPYYRIIWGVLKNHEYINALSFNELRTSSYINITNVNNIYEIWAFLKMIMTLITKFGWCLEDGKILSEYIENFIGNKRNKNLNGFNIELNKGAYNLRIEYTPKLPRVGLDPLTPDYRFIFKAPNKMRKVIYLDAKYRNYKEQGINEWEKDIKTVAIKKYLRTKSSDSSLNGDVSFILHCDQELGEIKEQEGVSYNVAYDNSFINLEDKTESLRKEEYGHVVGSIYFLPQATNSFINWFRMIMEYHLGQFHTCWNCGELENIDVTLAYTEKGHLKYYFQCNECDDFWVKVHCKNGHNIIKHTNNYHQQKKNSYAWYVICPICFNGRDDDSNIITEQFF